MQLTNIDVRINYDCMYLLIKRNDELEIHLFCTRDVLFTFKI